MKNVLIIDDDADTREVLQMALGGEGFQVEMAADRDAALTMIESSRPHAILLDYFMGGTDLESFLMRLPKYPIPVPIILMTGAEDSSKKARELGVPFSITKPFTIEALTELLGRAIKV